MYFDTLEGAIPTEDMKPASKCFASHDLLGITQTGSKKERRMNYSYQPYKKSSRASTIVSRTSSRKNTSANAIVNEVSKNSTKNTSANAFVNESNESDEPPSSLLKKKMIRVRKRTSNLQDASTSIGAAGFPVLPQIPSNKMSKSEENGNSDQNRNKSKTVVLRFRKDPVDLFPFLNLL